MRRRHLSPDPSDDASFYAPDLIEIDDEPTTERMSFEEHEAYWSRVRAEAGVDEADLPF